MAKYPYAVRLSSDKQRGSRPTLSRERVVRAAMDLADKTDIDGTSMRRLAQELGVEAMSLYHWFPSKDALLGAMVDATYAEMELPPTTEDWRADIRVCALSAKDVLLRHGWSAHLLGNLATPFGARFVWMNSVLGRLRTAGFSVSMTHHAYHATDSHIVGFVLWILPYLRITADMPDMARAFVQEIEQSDLPYLAEHAREHMVERQDEPGEFEFGLGLILDGLERLRVREVATDKRP